ncbi:Hypothetical protein MAGa3430 [Mycoplasmopsis agalactiae]|uniref:Uncharacterized protein n=1 Tax=Mycoplasmopsis agalactiae TaxID=2110 RepID=D3VQG3_MYCAA|nr:Hypothetical protein MAGa3430 [Mycoplasmopsis agalactiae]
MHVTIAIHLRISFLRFSSLGIVSKAILQNGSSQCLWIGTSSSRINAGLLNSLMFCSWSLANIAFLFSILAFATSGSLSIKAIILLWLYICNIYILLY